MNNPGDKKLSRHLQHFPHARFALAFISGILSFLLTVFVPDPPRISAGLGEKIRAGLK